MNLTSEERKIRRRLPFTRFIQGYAPLSIANRLIKLGLSQVKPNQGNSSETLIANDVSCEWIVPKDCSANKVLLYLHGGGFVYGLTPLHFKMVEYLAEKMGVRALLVDYRLAPANPFPAALDDCLSAYRWLMEQGVQSSDIAVAGDSAGGNLTLGTIMKLRENDDQLPVAAACLSPVANLADWNDSNRINADPLLHPRAIRLFNKAYIGNDNANNPYISPAFGDFQGFPPMLIHAGEDEILRHDAVCIDEKAREAGVETRLEIYPHMWHVWQLYLALPQAIQSLDEIAGFLKQHLGIAE